MKIVINNCFGGFGLSAKAILRYAELAGIQVYAYESKGIREPSIKIKDPLSLEEEPFMIYWLKTDLGEHADSNQLNNAEWFHDTEIKRDDPILVKVVKELGTEANGQCAELKIVTIPKGVEWIIEEYDGLEHIAEVHQTWG